MQKPTDIQFRSLKALLTNSNEDNVVEMLSSYLNMNKDEIGILTAIRMDVNLVDRLDKICVKYYGTIDLLDLLLEFNDITNPFDVPFGKVLFVPDKNNLIDQTKTPVLKNLIRLMNTDMNTVSEQDMTGSNQIKSNASSNFATTKASQRTALNNRGTGMKYDSKKITF